MFLDANIFEEIPSFSAPELISYPILFIYGKFNNCSVWRYCYLKLTLFKLNMRGTLDFIRERFKLWGQVLHLI